MNAHTRLLLPIVLAILPLAALACDHVKRHVKPAASDRIHTEWWTWVPDLYPVALAHDSQGNIVVSGGAVKGMDLDASDEGELKLSEGPGPGYINGTLIRPEGKPIDHVEVTVSPEGTFVTAALATTVSSDTAQFAPTLDGGYVVAQQLRDAETQALLEAASSMDRWNVELGLPATAAVARYDASGTELWQHTWEGPTGWQPWVIRTDGGGSVYVTIQMPRKIGYASEKERDASGHRDYDNDFLFAKLDAQGNLVWECRIENSRGIGLLEQPIDAAGNWYIGGQIYEPVTLTDAAGKVTQFESPPRIERHHWVTTAVIAKLTPAGVLAWDSRCGYDSHVVSTYKVAVAPDGSVYHALAFTGMAEFNPPDGKVTYSPTQLSARLALRKLDANGVFQWAKHWGGGVEATEGRNEIAASVLLTDAESRPLLLGYFAGPIDFDPGSPGGTLSTAAYGSNGFLLLLDAKGRTREVATYGNSLGGTAILDSAGDLLLCGGTSRGDGFDPKIPSQMTHQMQGQYLAKINLP